MRTAVSRSVLAATLVLPMAVGVSLSVAAPGEPCTEPMAGGDWATYGQDLSGKQRQLAEHTVNTSNVGTLERAWMRTGTGYQSPPPIVAGGCVFINTNGAIEALDIRSGNLVWRSQGADTSGTFAVTVVNGRVHVGLNNNGRPKAAAFDVRTGQLLWTSPEVYFGYQTTQQASAIVYDGIQVLFTTGPDFDPNALQGYALIDAATGQLLYKSTTIPQHLIDEGYAGGGAWGTPTVDAKTGYAYVGTSNPESKTKESDYDNAIIKLDLNRQRSTFGKIVATYKGTPDSVTGYDNPVCQRVGDRAYVNAGIYGSSPTCGQLDVDFGIGPTLWRNAQGRLMGAATQKSGVLHVFYADTMKRAWSRALFVTTSFAGGNFARIASDGKTLYVAANPGILRAFDAVTGKARWRAPLTGVPMKGGNVALANGVVYYVDEPGLRAFDAATGRRLWLSQLRPGATIGSGVAVAGHHVVANHYGTIAAYRLP